MTPSFLAWQRGLADQAQGFALWTLAVILCCGVVLVVCWRWQNPTSNPRLFLRLGIVVMFGGSLLLLLPLPNLLRLAIPAGAFGLVAYAWVDFFRHKPLQIRIPQVPAMVWIIVGGAALRIPMLILKNPWYDETFTASVVSRSLPDMWRVIQSDVHPPLFYLVEWVNVRLLGTSPAALRFPAFVCGVVCIYLVYRLAQRFFWLGYDRRIPYIAAAFAAALPAALNYSNDARMYSLLSMLVLGAALALIEHKPRLFMLTTALIPLTHNLGYLHLAVLGLLALWFWGRGWIKYVVPGAAAALEWFPFALGQAHDIADGFWLITTPADLLQPLQTMTAGIRVPNQYLLHVTGAIVALTALSLWTLRSYFHNEWGRMWLALVLGAPLLAAVVSFVWRPVYLDRAFLPNALLLTLPWAYFLTKINLGDRRTALAVIVPALAVAVVTYFNPAKYYDYGALISEGCQGTDMIFETKTAGRIISSYYSDLPQVLWTKANDQTQTLTDDAKDALGWRQVADISELHGSVCVLDWFTAHNTLAMDDYMTQLREQFPPVRTVKLIDEPYFWLNAYVVRLP